MKILICLLMLCPLFADAQHVTTDVEYNYLTKGYKTDIAEGRDLKSGYKLDPIIPEEAVGNYLFQISSFTKVDEKQVAAILVIAKSKTWNNTYYLCIPLGNRDLYSLYYQELVKWDAPMSQAYAYFTTTIFAGLLARDLNIELQK